MKAEHLEAFSAQPHMSSAALQAEIFAYDFSSTAARHAARAAFGRAVVVSLCVHALLLIFVPDFRNALPDFKIPERIDVLLMPPQVAEVAPPEPVPPPPQVRPEPEIKEVTPVPRKIEKPRPVQREERIITAPAEAPSPAPHVSEPPIPPVHEAAPVAEAPQPSTPAPSPAQVAPRPTQPAIEVPTEEVKSNWGAKFKAAIDQMRRYPRLAQQRGWQGTVTLMVHFAPGGKLADVNVVRSSGFEVLDDAAKDMVRNAQLPPMNESLRQHGFEWKVPVEFRLES